MLRKSLIIFGVGLLFSEGAFAGCGSWSLPWYTLPTLFVWLFMFLFFLRGLFLFSIGKKKTALLRIIPFIVLTGWILFFINF